ncbi:MAG TPA: hypothetical protein VHL79_03045 [Ramlibacter sp.]|jgi:hypothetical protein|nr:hypothetical protein [Ramlibacter sp.]
MKFFSRAIALVLFVGAAGAQAQTSTPRLLAGQAPAQPLTKQAYEAGKKRIDAEYKTDQKTCRTVKGHAREVCQVEAKGKADSARAELEADYKPSPEASQKAKNVIADANYDVAKKNCEAHKGDAKDKCQEMAKLAREAAIRQAKVEKVEETGGPFGNGAAATKKSSKS